MDVASFLKVQSLIYGSACAGAAQNFLSNLRRLKCQGGRSSRDRVVNESHQERDFWGAGEMTHQVRTFAILVDGLASVPSTHLVAQNHL